MNEGIIVLSCITYLLVARIGLRLLLPVNRNKYAGEHGTTMVLAA